MNTPLSAEQASEYNSRLRNIMVFMGILMNSSPIIVVMLVVLLSFSPSAFAYLDPSTGSMIISAVIGLFATAVLAIKTYWYKFVGIFKGDQRDKKAASEDTQQNQDSTSKS